MCCSTGSAAPPDPRSLACAHRHGPARRRGPGSPATEPRSDDHRRRRRRRRPRRRRSSSASAPGAAAGLGGRRRRVLFRGRERMTGAHPCGHVGGVDSSVAAALVARTGVEAVGVWMRLHDGADSFSRRQALCCSPDAADDARRVAGQLGIPFYILDLEREFEAGVMRPFLDGYLAGRTPSPCIDCNSTVKFGALLGPRPGLYGCDAVATGHYARVRRVPDPTQPTAIATTCWPAWTPTRTRATSCTACARTSWPTAASPGRPDQAPGARHRGGAGPGDRGQAREPGAVLRARR